MTKSFHVNILTPDKAVYEGKAVSMVVPAEGGYLGVLANHAPLVAILAKGTITLRDESGRTTVFNSKGKGVVEVLENDATILLES